MLLYITDMYLPFTNEIFSNMRSSQNLEGRSSLNCYVLRNIVYDKTTQY